MVFDDPNSHGKKIPLTDKMRAALISEKERTNYAPFSLFRDHIRTDINKPEGLTKEIIDGWFYKNIETVREDHFDYVLSKYKSLLNHVNHQIPFTDEMFEALIHERQRTSVGHIKLLDILFKDSPSKPKGLTSNMVCNWFWRGVKSVHAHHYNYVMDKYKSLPGRAAPTAPLTPDMRKELKAERQRTQLSAQKLLEKYCNNDPERPDGLTSSKIHKWLSDSVQSVDEELFQYVLRKYRSAPSSKNKRGPFTAQMFEMLSSERNRTGVGSRKLLNVLFKNDPEKPENLHVTTADNWLNSRPKTVNLEHYNYIISRYQTLPEGEWKTTARAVYQAMPVTDEMRNTLGRIHKQAPLNYLKKSDIIGAQQSIIRILYHGQKSISVKLWEFYESIDELRPDEFFTVENTPEVQAKLQAEINRTNIGAIKFIKVVKGLPVDFTASTLANWTSGRVKKITKADLDFVLGQYEKFPDANVPMSQKMKQKIQDEMLRTNVTSAAVLADHPDKPKSLNMQIVASVLRGEATKIHADHWDFIIARFAGLPDVETHLVSEDDLEKLAEELRLKRINASRLNKVIKAKTSRKLQSSYVKKIIEGKIARVPIEDWAAILAALEKVPVSPETRGGRGSSNYIAFTEEMQSELNHHLDRTGVSYGFLIQKMPDGLPKLNTNKISRLKYGSVRTIPLDEWHYLVNILRDLPDKAQRKEPFKPRKTWPDHVPITDEHIKQIKYHRKRTGIGTSQLFSLAEKIPDGLRTYIVSSWISGGSKTAKKEYIDWIIQEYKKHPNIP